MLAQVVFTFGEPEVNHNNTGLANRGSDATGILEIEQLSVVRDGQVSMTIRLQLREDPAGRFPDEVQQPLAFLRHFGAPNQRRVATTRGRRQQQTVSIPTAPHNEERERWLDFLLRYVQALVTIQEHVEKELRVPHISRSLLTVHNVVDGSDRGCCGPVAVGLSAGSPRRASCLAGGRVPSSRSRLRSASFSVRSCSSCSVSWRLRSIAFASLVRRDPAGGVPLFTRCIEIRREIRVDDRRVLVDFQACCAPSKDKELVVIEGWPHYDLYDQPEPVQQALDHLIPFQKKFL